MYNEDSERAHADIQLGARRPDCNDDTHTSFEVFQMMCLEDFYLFFLKKILRLMS